MLYSTIIRNGVLLLSTPPSIAQATTERSLPTVDLGDKVRRVILYNFSRLFNPRIHSR